MAILFKSHKTHLGIPLLRIYPKAKVSKKKGKLCSELFQIPKPGKKPNSLGDG